jgi:hypothetical protein
MEGSSHSYHLALHCLGVFLTSKDDIRAHCYIISYVHLFKMRVLTFFPYFEMAAFKISSSVHCQLTIMMLQVDASLPVLRQTPPLMMIRTCFRSAGRLGIVEKYTPFLRTTSQVRAEKCIHASLTCALLLGRCKGYRNSYGRYIGDR